MKKSKNTREWLTELVSFDTTSRNSNLNLINRIHEWFISHAIDIRLSHDDTKQKANLFATLPGSESATHGGIVLSGHTDVVPVDGQQWDSNPFQAIEKDGRIYGRGTSDMKGFLAVILAMAPELKKKSLSKPIHFAFSYDEEVGCKGAPIMIHDFQQHGIHPMACIVGEPTSMHPVVAHKGIILFRCRVHGRAAHSSLTNRGCNAIEYASQIIARIREMADKLKISGPLDNFFDVPFTSVSTNLIQGGTAGNIIPSFTEFFFEIRYLPGINPQNFKDQLYHFIQQDLLPKMRSEYPEAEIVIDTIAGVPGFEASEEANLTKIIRKFTQEEQTHKVAYATEAGLFQQAGIPTILCGPGSIEQAHRPNEFIDVEQLDKCENFLRDFIQHFQETN